MSNQKFNLCRVIALVPTMVREALIYRYEPAHPLIYCQEITLAYRVQRGEATFPKGEVPVRVIGLHRDDACDVLFLSVNGYHHRPDGRRWALTLSVANHLEPAAAITRAVAQPFTPVKDRDSFRTRFHEAPLWVFRPTLNPRPARTRDLVAA